MGEERGLEWNILIYRVVNDLVFAKLISAIDPICKNPFDKDFHKISKKTMAKLILFGLFLILANCAVFMKV